MTDLMSRKRRSVIVMATPVILGAAGAALAQGSRHALRFHGTGRDQQDRVRIAIDDDAPGPDASAPCDVGNGDFTVEFWLRGRLRDNRTDHDGGDVESWDFRWIDGNIVVDRDIWGDSARDWGLSVAGGFVRFGTGSGDGCCDQENTIEGDALVLDGVWRHVAATRDASTGVKTIYVDGVLDFQSSPQASRADISYPDDGTDQLTPWGPYIVIAAEKHDAGANYPSFNGYVDEVRIWNTARSARDIQDDYRRVIDGATPGLVAYYRFEEGQGTRVRDESAAASPDGELIRGIPGNGEWVAYADDPNNTAPVTPLDVPGDFDADGDVDLKDGKRFQECFTGPDAGPIEPGCEEGDRDGDDDIDLTDYATWSETMSGPRV